MGGKASFNFKSYSRDTLISIHKDRSVAVRVVPPRELAVRLLDVLGGGFLVDA